MHKMRGTPWLAKELGASQEGFWSVEWVTGCRRAYGDHMIVDCDDVYIA